MSGVSAIGCKVGPVFGPELGANGSFDTAGAGGADVFGSWTEQTVGSSTINRDTSDYYSSPASCRMDIDGSDNVAIISQVITLEVGKRYRLSLLYKASTNNEVSRLLFTDYPAGDHTLQSDGSWVGSSINLTNTTSWQYFFVDFYPVDAHTEYTLQINRFANENDSIWFDDVSIKEIQ